MKLYSEEKQVKLSGQALIMVFAIMLFFFAVVETVVFMLSSDTKWTEKEKRKNFAFQLADLAQSRAYWKITETSTGFDDIIAGNIPSGFDGSTVFNDDLGFYKIHVSTGKDGDEVFVVIRTVGSDKNYSEVRAIKTVYKKLSNPESAINTKLGIELKGKALVHWGGIISKSGNIQIQSSDPWWPRKFAGAGFIVTSRDTDLGLPNIGPPTSKDGRVVEEIYQEWSSNDYRHAETIDIDKEYYKALAKAYVTPSNAPSRSSANPPNSGYYEGIDIQFGNNYVEICSSAVYYVKGGNVSFKNANGYIGPAYNASGAVSKCAIIVETGNIAMPNNAPVGSPGRSNYVVKVPTTAWKEYQIQTEFNSNTGDTVAVGEYPGDLGYRSSGGTYSLNDVNFHGLLYVGGNLSQGSGHQTIVGVVIVKGTINKTTGTSDFYYDKTVDDDIVYTGMKFSKVYWAEFLAGSFSAPDWSR